MFLQQRHTSVSVVSIIRLYLIPFPSNSFLPDHFHCLIHQRFHKGLNISFHAADEKNASMKEIANTINMDSVLEPNLEPRT